MKYPPPLDIDYLNLMVNDVQAIGKNLAELVRTNTLDPRLRWEGGEQKCATIVHVNIAQSLSLERRAKKEPREIRAYRVRILREYVRVQLVAAGWTDYGKNRYGKINIYGRTETTNDGL